MSEQQVEIARGFLDALNRHDRDGWMACTDPEIEWDPPADWPESGRITGADAVWEFIVTLDDPWEEGKYEIVEIVDPDGDRLVGLLRRRMRGKASGAVVEFEYWSVVTFAGDRIRRCRMFSDRAEALEAAGS